MKDPFVLLDAVPTNVWSNDEDRSLVCVAPVGSGGEWGYQTARDGVSARLLVETGFDRIDEHVFQAGLLEAGTRIEIEGIPPLVGTDQIDADSTHVEPFHEGCDPVDVLRNRIRLAQAKFG